jgi:UDP-glucose 6-dehydrogenase
MAVPGPDGKRGFGGMCFPKDTAGLLHYAKDMGINMDILETAVYKNKQLRDDL